MVDLAGCVGGVEVSADDVFAALARSKRAFHTPAMIACAFPSRSRRVGAGWEDSRVGVEAVMDAVADLEAEGRVETWEHPERGPLVILSALSAEALGWELNAVSRRWKPVGENSGAIRLKARKRARTAVESGELKDVEPEAPQAETPKGGKAAKQSERRADLYPNAARFFLLSIQDRRARERGTSANSAPGTPYKSDGERGLF